MKTKVKLKEEKVKKTLLSCSALGVFDKPQSKKQYDYEQLKKTP